jgi:hypothetical protein
MLADYTRAIRGAMAAGAPGRVIFDLRDGTIKFEPIAEKTPSKSEGVSDCGPPKPPIVL